MELILVFLLGFIFGSLGFKLLLKTKNAGTIMVIPSDEKDGNPYLFLELGESVSELMRKKGGYFSVDASKFFPHK